jgi:hypothetical protein
LRPADRARRAWYAFQRVSEQDESPVSRRQFFRGVTGGLFRSLGELSGIDRLVEEETAPILSFTEDDVLVPPEKQAESLSMIFNFLEQQKAEAEAETAPLELEAETAPPPQPEPEAPRPESD